MQINYPPQIDTDMKKIRFILRVIEVFRKGHNFMGYWYKTGFSTENKYNVGLTQIPVPAKNWILNHYPYASHGEFLTDQEWHDFGEIFKNKSKWIMHYRNVQMQIFFDYNTNDSIINMDGVLT